ncbi:MAG TPA: hypothetical protein VGI40_02800 [Pirellulaceae bacterium]
MSGLNQLVLLSPASCSGQRAALLFNERAEFFLARKLRSEGATLGEIFSFLSGLYYRGKLTYARAFSQPRADSNAIWTITAGRGLIDPATIITLDELRQFSEVPIHIDEPRYREPLLRDAAKLAKILPNTGPAVLLGSVASDKYVPILHEAFGDRLVFPQDFVGRGDMSRGGLLLRAVDEGEELSYVPVMTSIRRGRRPKKLPPRKTRP